MGALYVVGAPTGNSFLLQLVTKRYGLGIAAIETNFLFAFSLIT
jgi:hypothetical protein